MKRLTPLLLVAALTACGPSEPPKQQANVPTVVNQRAKLTRQPGISALNFDHPG